MENIIQIIRQYLSDPLVNLIAATILGFIPTIIDRLQRRVKQIWWGAKSVSLPASNFAATGNLRVKYKKSGQRSFVDATKGLSICRFVFWNNGKETILDNNISSHEPLILHFGNEREVLEIRELHYSNPSINIQKISPHHISVNFEYLENKQGAVFDIIHSGEKVTPYLAGKIKGGKVNRKLVTFPEISMSATPKLYLLMGWMKPAQQVVAMRWFSTVATISLLWFFLMIPTFLANAESKPDWFFLVYMVLIFIAYAFTAVFSWKTAVVPVDLREFYSKLIEKDDDF
jgi:hypothetical protein